MTAEQFAYWMQGFAELTGDEPPTAAQWKSMREHLQTVFVKVTPPVGVPTMPGRIPDPYQVKQPHDWGCVGTLPHPLIATCTTC